MASETAIQLRQDFFSPEQEKMIRDMFLAGAPAGEAAVLMEIAKARRLNPFTKQIHFVKRWDGMKQQEVWSAQIGIDGLRAQAERTGKYDGQDEPEYERDPKTGALTACRVRVYRKDWGRPAVGVAYWTEYVQTKKDGKPNAAWSRMPHVMLAKCAEALAIRKAFPEDTSGLYIPEELGGGEEKEINPPPASAPASSSRTAAVKAEVRRKVQIVDVAPGESEEAAAERAKGLPYERLLRTMEERGVDLRTWAPELKRLTGKTKRADVTGEDVATVVGFFFPEPPDDVPPPSDSDAPAPEAQ